MERNKDGYKRTSTNCPGEVLDNITILGQDIITYVVVAFDPVPDDEGYNHGLMDCPHCNSNNTHVIRRSNSDDYGYNGYPDYYWHCKDCWVVWKAKCSRIGDIT